MPFYTSIAPWYDAIFPLKPAQLRFVRERAPDVAWILDIGSATGGLACALAEAGHSVLGVEPDEAMLRIAQGRAPEGARFIAGDMRQPQGEGAFDLALCLGNTLVHLDGPEAITQALRAMRRALTPGGALILQIINYDRILDEGLEGLPTIEREGLRFERRYRRAEGAPHLHFETRLTPPDGVRVIEDSVPLYPLRRAELEGALGAAGLRPEAWFGGFDGRPAGPEAQPLIVVARPVL